MSVAIGARALAAVTVVAAVLCAGAIAAERHLVRDAAARRDALRGLRVELQGVSRAGVLLERGGDRLDTLRAGADDTRIAILEAVDALARSSSVALLDHALRDVRDEAVDLHDASPKDVRTLRLTLELEAAHALRLTRALADLGRALPGRPADVAGCRIDRANESGADDGVGDVEGPLIASCAIDWYWWPA